MSGRVQCFDLCYLLQCQFGSAVLFAGRMISASLYFFIVIVVGDRSIEQVVDVYTFSVVTFMQNARFFQFKVFEEHPCDAMCKHGFSHEREATVSAFFVKCSGPFKATVLRAHGFLKKAYSCLFDIFSTVPTPFHVAHCSSIVTTTGNHT